MTTPDFSDLACFVEVIRHRGFTAAARATGIDKTRLSRRVVALEEFLGVRLLQRSTRSISLTEAGERFYEHSLAAVEQAEAAYRNVADLSKEPSGRVRMSCPPVLAQSYLAPILPQYLAAHPKVNLVIEPTDREVDLIEDRIDLALLARPQSTAMTITNMVIRELGTAHRILVASPALRETLGNPTRPEELGGLPTIGPSADLNDGRARWELACPHGQLRTVLHFPRLQTTDLRLQLETAIGGIGIALLPEPIVAASIRSGLLVRLLPEWSAPPNTLCLAYAGPRGLLPSVRSLIDYLVAHLPPVIVQRSVRADTIADGRPFDRGSQNARGRRPRT